MGAAYTKRWPPLPAVLPTHSTHRASTAPLTETGDGQDGMGIGDGGRQAQGVSAEAGQWCPHGVVYYNSISQGRRQQHTQAPSP